MKTIAKIALSIVTITLGAIIFTTTIPRANSHSVADRANNKESPSDGANGNSASNYKKATDAGGTNTGVCGFTHYLGETFNGGIIYYLYKGSDGFEHGLIVAPEESEAALQTSDVLVNADRSEDGAYNTALMKNSPAATYIASLGAGWYLPSIDELGLMYFNRYSVQKGLRTSGNTLLSFSYGYWSSNEENSNAAMVFDFCGGGGFPDYKTHIYNVRGIRAF
jgi:hypothetical protein